MNYDEAVSCRAIKSCLDYAFIRNIDLEEIILKHDYSDELIEDSYNWVSISFFNEIISKIERHTGKSGIAFDIGSDSTTRNSWGDIENVIKAIADPKPILLRVERFTAYFLQHAIVKLIESDSNSITIKSTDSSYQFHNAVQFMIGVLISIPRLWGGNDLSAIKLRDGGIRINFNEEPSFFDLSNDYKRYSPQLLEDIISGLEKTKNLIEHKNKLLEKKNIELEEAYKKLEKTLEEKIQSEKMTILGKLSVGIAHEINNPLSFIISNFKSLKKHFNTLEQNTEDMVNDIPVLFSETEEGLLRVKKLVEDINYMAHPGHGEKSEVDIQEIIKGAIRITKNLHKKDISIVENYDHRSLIYCRPSKLSQVFLNLILNSIHAIELKEPDSAKGEIIFSTKEEHGSIEIMISDNGIGINSVDLPHIVEPFFTTKKTGEGTGLGLSTVCSIINSHSGDISFESTEDAGTKVKITLPFNPESASKTSLF